jgi:hypothetical protein
MKWLKLLSPLYLLTILALFIYSFTQVDLSLTLSKVSIYQLTEKYLQNIGFFQRPLSTIMYVVILVFLITFYLIFLYQTLKKKINSGSIWKIIIFTTVVLIFSYNAFSYDLFNYIFDAKIVTHYHLVPYFYSALDFPKDPMLSFMRWTHRTFPYGPSWLALTVPLSFIGMNYFLPTFFLFKLLMGASFLGSCYLIYKISEKIFPESKLLNLVFFALNPLVLIESLVSAHNDIPMIFFFLLSIYLFLQKRKALSFISNIFSIGVKFSTGVIFPIFLVLEFMDRKNKKINWELFFIGSFLLSLLTVVLATIRSTFQPWYLVLPLSLAAFIPRKSYFFVLSVIATLFGLLIYVPYVYMTDYAKEYPIIINYIEIIGILVILLFTAFYCLKLKISPKH